MALAQPFPKVIDGSTFHRMPDWQQDQLRAMLRDSGVDPDTCALVEVLDEATMRVTEHVRNDEGKFYVDHVSGCPQCRVHDALGHLVGCSERGCRIAQRTRVVSCRPR